MTRSAEDRRLYAITRSMERQREELAPVRAEMAALIDEMGWRRAMHLTQAALGRPVKRQGLWALGKRDTAKVLEALRNPKGQLALFDPKVPATSAGQPGATPTACGGDSPRHQEPAVVPEEGVAQ